MKEQPLIGQILNPVETTRYRALAATANFLAIDSVKRIPPDTAIHEQNGYVKVYNDKYTFITNVDNSDMTYTDKHNMREV